jgi:rod shape determining protein RodA
MTTNAIQTPEQPRPTAALRVVLRMDIWLFIAAIGLSLCSYMAVRHAGNTGGAELAHKQLLYAGIGLVLAFLISRFDYTILREYRYVFYVLAIVLNIAVFGFSGSSANAANGASRWIPLPLFQLQPSEFGKVLLVVTLAAFAVDRTRRMSERRVVAQTMLLALVPAAIVMKQPDLGTALVYIAMAVAVLFFAGINWKYLTALLALFAVAMAVVLAVAPAIGVNVLQTYQKQRLTTFVDGVGNCSNKNPTCYQLQQGFIAIASGGKTGRGTNGATQVKDGYVPEASTDFIFAVVGETWGFAGAALVISLYALLIWRALRIVTLSKNLFGTLIAGGIAAMWMFQVFLNIGMTVGIMPVTGVPLPLMTYGGSSVIVTFLAIGLLESIHVQARMTSANKARVLLV